MVDSAVVDDSKGQMQRSDDSHRRAATRETPESQQRQHPQKQANRKKQKAGHRAKHRLRSIHRDVQAMENLQNSTHNNTHNNNNGLTTHALRNWKLIPNERCGSWYIPPDYSTTSCYFKSTDGHRNFWDFSLKRLNLGLLESIVVVDGGCVLVDSSVRKLLPDSFSKTIPIWAAVLNTFVGKHKDDDDNSWDDNTTELRTPKGIVSQHEHDQIASLIPERVETLVRSGAIVNPQKLIETLTKPLKVVWMNHEGKICASNGENMESTATADLLEEYFVVVCWNPSRYQPKPTTNTQEELIALKKHQTEWIAEDDEVSGYYYTPGAADDHESWAKHLDPALFWKNKESLLDPTLDDNQVDALIDVLVEQERNAQEALENVEQQSGETPTGSSSSKAMETVYSYSDRIGETNLWIGSRRASRPPECWSGFDAILNVTNQEYDYDMMNQQSGKYYLRLPVEEGKRDRTQLEKYMPVGVLFLIHHLQQSRRVLVHCAQGKDRSVAVALVLVVMVCPLQFPLRYKQEFENQSWDLCTLQNCTSTGDNPKKPTGDDDPDEKETCTNSKSQLYCSSGLPDAIVKRVLDEGGRELFLLWIHQEQLDDTRTARAPLADKEGVRIALHLIKQDRQVAEPTRATMQKINRFLMSSSIYR